MRTMICGLFVVYAILVLGGQGGAAERRVLFLGDSLTAGYGVEQQQAYPALVAQRLEQEGVSGVRIINGSVSGSTSASGPERFRWYQRQRPQILFFALGANDGLRGLSTTDLANNLASVIEAALQQHMVVLLAGMEVPPNYGEQYARDFRQVYRQLAARYQITLIPFLLEGVGGRAEMNQSDGIHPNAAGHRQIAQIVYPYLKKAVLSLP